MGRPCAGAQAASVKTEAETSAQKPEGGEKHWGAARGKLLEAEGTAGTSFWEKEAARRGPEAGERRGEGAHCKRPTAGSGEAWRARSGEASFS